VTRAPRPVMLRHATNKPRSAAAHNPRDDTGQGRTLLALWLGALTLCTLVGVTAAPVAVIAVTAAVVGEVNAPSPPVRQRRRLCARPSIVVVTGMPMARRIVGVTSSVRKLSEVFLPSMPGDQKTIGTRWTLSCAPPWSP
ncbi:MAG: hypothetical protein JWQ67_380, partial [Marmoricola sp.]|nr:hypothetical protein [Marmoricola sp.]